MRKQNKRGTEQYFIANEKVNLNAGLQLEATKILSLNKPCRTCESRYSDKLYSCKQKGEYAAFSKLNFADFLPTRWHLELSCTLAFKNPPLGI